MASFQPRMRAWQLSCAPPSRTEVCDAAVPGPSLSARQFPPLVRVSDSLDCLAMCSSSPSLPVSFCLSLPSCLFLPLSAFLSACLSLSASLCLPVSACLSLSVSFCLSLSSYRPVSQCLSLSLPCSLFLCLSPSSKAERQQGAPSRPQRASGDPCSLPPPPTHSPSLCPVTPTWRR